MAAFLKAMGSHVGSTICELQARELKRRSVSPQVGMGPCGELRYPSYMMPFLRFETIK